MEACQFKLLVVEDDPLILDSLKLVLPSQWQMHGALSGKNLSSMTFHAAFVDIHLSGNLSKKEGLEVIQELRRREPHMEIVAMSGDLTRDVMESSLRKGASRFLAKPLSAGEAKLTLDQVESLILLRQATCRKGTFTGWVGSSPTSENIRQKVALFSGEVGPILIEGDSGTGKEVVAGLMHSLKPGKTMISVNVAAISESLFESEFFGHVKGAFTGADRNKMGLAEAAHGGILFLDEIEALSLPMQVKLLRFLESGEVRRVGAKEGLEVKAQVIVATNKSLEALVRERKFREDLLWRLCGKKIHLPPLRERSEDIPELTQHFLSLDKVRKKYFSPEAMKKLCSYSWPGNVRELKRICEQLLAESPLPMIRMEDVARVLPHSSPPMHLKTKADFHCGLQTIVDRFEGEVIEECLYKTNDIDEASEILKVSRSTLYRKIKDHSIEWKSLSENHHGGHRYE